MKTLIATIALLTAFFLSGCSADTFSADDAGDDAGEALDGDPGPGDAMDEKLGVHLDASTDASDGNVNDVTNDPPVVTSRRAFITSQHFTAALGGVAGADAKCTSTAIAAGLGGTWTAWISTLASSAASRMTHDSVPWKLLDGTIVANDWPTLISGAPLSHSIDLDEHGAFVPYTGDASGLAWTSTHWDGTSVLLHGATEDCSGLTSADPDGGTTPAATAGRDDLTTSVVPSWTEATNDECFIALSLYCFEK